MGIPIIYCDKCQEIIPSSEIEQKKMVCMAGKNYCHKCSVVILGKAPSQIVKNANMPAGKPTGMHGTQSLGSSRPAAASRTGRTSSANKTEEKAHGKYIVHKKKSSSNNMYIIGGVVGGVVLLIILIIVLSSGSNTPPPKKTSAKTVVKPKEDEPKKESPQEILAKAEKAFGSVVEYENKNPLDSKGILEKISQAIGLVANTEYEKKMEEKRSEHREKKKVLDEINDYVLSYEKNPSDHEHYINSYTQLKDKAQSLKNNADLINFIEEQIKKVNETINKEVVTEFEKLKEEVAELKKENLFDQAIRSCESFQFKDNKTIGEEIDGMISDLKRDREIYIRKKRDDWKFLFNEDNMDTSSWFAFPAGIIKARLVKEDKAIALENSGAQNPKEQETYGFILMGDSDWKNYTIEVEYKVTQGAANVAVRFDYQPLKDAAGQPNTELDIKPPHLVPLQRTFADKWLKVNIEVKDKNIVIREDGKQEQKKTMPQQVSEQGGFGFVLRPGDKILVKSIKVKGVE